MVSLSLSLDLGLWVSGSKAVSDKVEVKVRATRATEVGKGWVRGRTQRGAWCLGLAFFPIARRSFPARTTKSESRDPVRASEARRDKEGQVLM
jgi:hypothetical protein